MLRTFSLISERIIYDLSELVIKYIRSEDRDWHLVAKAGEYETCLSATWQYFDDCFCGASAGGHIEIAKLMILFGCRIHDWNSGIEYAASNGHKELVELIISSGAKHLDSGLYSACCGGHKEIAELLIHHGASAWNYGLYGACYSEKKELVKLMVTKGANACAYCRDSMEDHLNA